MDNVPRMTAVYIRKHLWTLPLGAAVAAGALLACRGRGAVLQAAAAALAGMAVPLAALAAHLHIQIRRFVASSLSEDLQE